MIKILNLKFRIVLTALLVFSMNTFAQSDILWKKNFGGDEWDMFFSVTAVSDGIIAAGYAWTLSAGDWEGVTGKGGDDATIVKYDNNGNVVWKKNFGGKGSDVYYSITTVSDGFVAAGWSSYSSFGNGDWEGVAGKGGYTEDAIIVKYDNNGNVVWKKNFGGSKESYYNSVTAVSDGVVAVGFSYIDGTGDWNGVTGKGIYDAIIVKYDNNGNVVWKKNFGGSGYDCYNSVTAVSDGIVAVGNSNSGFGSGDWAGFTGKGFDDAIIVKYDNNGNVVWKKNFGGSAPDIYKSVTAVSDGVIAVGYSIHYSFDADDWEGVTSKGEYDAIIVKFDNGGNVVWKKNFGGNHQNFYNSVTAVSDGIIAVGYSSSQSFGSGDWEGIMGHGIGYSPDAIIVKYNHNGSMVWKKNFGGSSWDEYRSVTAVSDGIIAVGYSGGESFNTGDWADVTERGIGNYAIVVKYDKTVMKGMGITELAQDASGLIIYPNPTTGQLIIDNGQLLIESVEIFDVFGRNVDMNLRVRPETEITIDISHLPAGIYFVRVDGKTAKIIKN